MAASTMKHRVESRGWSMQGIVPMENAVRNCARWNTLEEKDLIQAYKYGMPIAWLCLTFGRTTSGLAHRLKDLGVIFDKYDDLDEERQIASRKEQNEFRFKPRTLVTPPSIERALSCPSSFQRPPETVNCRSSTQPVTFGATVTMSALNVNRLMLLLSVYRGTHSQDPVFGSYQSDVAFLKMRGLLLGDATIPGTMKVTEDGVALVKHILDKSDLKTVTQEEVPTVFTERGPRMLTDATYYMVANGDLASEVGQLQLKNPPRVVHAAHTRATDEAIRLAKAHEGQKFFVLKAVSVHEVTKPVTSVRLS